MWCAASVRYPLMKSFDESIATLDQPVDVLIANDCSQWDKENRLKTANVEKSHK